MDDLWSLGVADIVGGVRQGTWSAGEVIDSIGARIAALEPDLKAWAWLDLDRAAGAVETTTPAGALAGVPVAVKDVIATCDLPTGMGSPLFDGYRPAEDAGVVAMLRAAGAVIPGKTVTTAFAGPDPAATSNPWNATRTPGGSSSGSAAAVASGMVPAALGTQTAGSVLRPAAYCGVVGFKPTSGAIDTSGVFPFARSLDTVGIMARAMGDIALVFDAIRTDGGARRPAVAGAPRRARLVECAAIASAEVRAQCATVAEQLSSGGVDISEDQLPVDLDLVAAAQGVIVRAEGASVHYDGILARPQDYGPGLRGLVETGLLITAPVYDKAGRIRAALSAVVEDWLAPQDVLLLPTVDGPVPDRSTTGNPALQAIFTFLGMPALTVPTGFGADGMPLSIQIVARRGEDDHLLAVGAWMQEQLDRPFQFPDPTEE